MKDKVIPSDIKATRTARIACLLLGASVARLAFEREDQDSVFFLFR